MHTTPRPSSADRPPRLTPTEARLLAALRSRPGHAFTRAELVGMVMADTIVTGRTIDVHIRALRAKLGEAARPIRTVRGVGYQFVSTDT